MHYQLINNKFVKLDCFEHQVIKEKLIKQNKIGSYVLNTVSFHIYKNKTQDYPLLYETILFKINLKENNEEWCEVYSKKYFEKEKSKIEHLKIFKNIKNYLKNNKIIDDITLIKNIEQTRFILKL